MKAEKIQNAIGHIGEDLIAEAEERPHAARRFSKWIAAVAAMLAVVIAVSVYLRPMTDDPIILRAYAMETAVYPTQAPFPDENKYHGDAWSAANKAWHDNKTQIKTKYGAVPLELNGFFQTTIADVLSGNGTQNTVYSPINVYMALAMLAEVCAGNSRQQLLELLECEGVEQLRAQTEAVWNLNYCNDGATTCVPANSMWLSDAVNYNSNTLQTLADRYYASAFRGKMGSADYNKALQTWLNEQTGNLLADKIADINMDVQTVLALASTVRFQASWSSKFSEQSTAKRVFYAPDQKMTCDFMNKRGTNIYYWGEQFSAVSIDLENSGSVWIVLPDETTTVDALLQDEEALRFILSNGEWENKKQVTVDLSIPKFDVSSSVDLSENLKRLGVTDIFRDSTADFTPLTTEMPIEVSQVEHGARVQIDEKGCTAAAYTVAILRGTSAMPPEDEIDFVADRPFLFAITSDAGMPLFVGTIYQPNI